MARVSFSDLPGKSLSKHYMARQQTCNLKM